MKKASLIKRRLIIAVLLVMCICYQSCKNVNEYENTENECVQDLGLNEHACLSAKDMQGPPPNKNEILSSEKVKVIEKNTSYFVTLNLIVDQLVDYQGEPQQIYRVERAKGDMHRIYKNNFYFALPTEYNKHWGDLRIFSEKDTPQLWIGFKNNDELIKFYTIYSYKYVDEQFGGGEIIIESTSNKEFDAI